MENYEKQETIYLQGKVKHIKRKKKQSYDFKTFVFSWVHCSSLFMQKWCSAYQATLLENDNIIS